jgi:sugar phosphate isomerase/epimerase
MKLGCNTVLFGMTDLSTALQHLAWAGYAGAELAALPGMADHVDPDRDRARASEISSQARELGLALVAIEAGGDLERRKRTFDFAAALGIRTVCVGSGGKPDDPASWDETIRQLRELAKAAENAGVIVAVKSHVGAAVYSTATAKRAFQEVDSKAYGINWDPSHLYRNNEDVVESAGLLAPYMRHVHIRDCVSRDQKVGPPEDQIPGRGNLDLPRVLQAMRAGGYDGWLDLEVIGAKSYPLSRAMGVAAETRGYLNRVIQEIGAN